MRRILIITAMVAVALIGAVMIAAIAVFYTPPGRAMLAGVIEQQMGKALNSKASIGALKGAPPGRIVLEDVRLADAAGPWLTARQAELRWRPLALLRKKISVDELKLTGAQLYRSPPKAEKTTQDDARRIKIVKQAPNVDIRAFEITAFIFELNGEPQQLDGDGAVRLDDTDIAVRLTLTSDGGADRANITMEKSPRNNHFLLDAALNAQVGGVITTLLNLDGPLRFDASGEGALADAEIKLAGVIGKYGVLDAVLNTDLNDFTGADIDLHVEPGSRIITVEELSTPLALNARYDAKARGGALKIHSFEGAIGAFSGDLAWSAPRGLVEQLTANLTGALAQTYRPEIQGFTGDQLALDAVLDWRRDDYELTLNLAGPRIQLALNKGVTDLRNRLSGALEMALTADNAASPLLCAGASLSAQLDADLQTAIRFNAARLTTGNGSRFSGAGAYGLTDKNLTLDGDIILTPALIEQLAPGIKAQGDVAGDIALNGPLNRFTIKTAIDAPELQMKSGAFPAMSIEAALSGLPRLPNGEITARAQNGGVRRLDASFRSSVDGLIKLPKINYAGARFSLSGNASVDPDKKTLRADLFYKGEAEAQPWPGINLAGDATIQGVASRDGALNNMTVRTGALAYNNIAASNLNLTAQGPPGAVTLSLNGDSLTAPVAGPMTELSANATADLRGAPVLTLTAFEAVIGGSKARLTAPAQLSLQDGARVDNLRLAYGRVGTIALDGAFEKSRWRAQAVLDKVNVPNADGQVTMNMMLDTDKATPATADFLLRSLLLKEEAATLRGNAVWNGKTLRLTDDANDPSLDMDIRLPAQLIKTPSLRIDATGALDGRIAYDGDVQALAAYMPPVLQTIEGAFSANFTIAGDTKEPILSGKANIKDGAYTEIESGFSLAGLHAQAQADYAGADSVVAFTGGARGASQSQQDTITFNGDARFGENGSVNLAVKLDNAELSAAPVKKVRANGALTVNGPLSGLTAKGDIEIIELDAEIVTPENTGLVDIEVIAFNNDEAAPEELAPPRASGLDFSITIIADDRVFISGRGLESEWSGNVTAVDGREAPLILGRLKVRRGNLDFSGRRFDLTRGEITFDRLQANNPVLDIRAEHQTSDGVTAAIVVTGRAIEPKITLESTPALPQEDVMALVLFGKPAQTLSPFESLQTAEALASLSGIGPFGGEGLTGRLRRTVGLDMLNVDIDPENGGGSLTLGKYVADGFFVSATQDAEGRNGSVRVKYDITDNITVETEIEQTGDQTVSANWKKDF